MGAVRSSLYFSTLLSLLLIVFEALLTPLPVASELDASAFRIYGPIVIYHGDRVSLMLFDESFFNITYRNVYVYISGSILLAEEVKHIGDLYSDVSKFSVNPYSVEEYTYGDSYSTEPAAGVDGWSVAKYVDEQVGRPITLAVKSFGDVILIVVKSIQGLGEGAKLLEIGRSISSTYGKRVEIISTSPFDGFFNGKYNGTEIGYEAARVASEIGLKDAIIGIAGWAPALSLYAALYLDIDKLEEIAKSNNTDLETLIKKLIDGVRERVSEDIPLSIIVGKRGRIVPLAAANSVTPANSGDDVIIRGNNVDPSTTAVAIATVALVLLMVHVARKVRR